MIKCKFGKELKFLNCKWKEIINYTFLGQTLHQVWYVSNQRGHNILIKHHLVYAISLHVVFVSSNQISTFIVIFKKKNIYRFSPEGTLTTTYVVGSVSVCLSTWLCVFGISKGTSYHIGKKFQRKNYLDFNTDNLRFQLTTLNDSSGKKLKFDNAEVKYPGITLLSILHIVCRLHLYLCRN